jgi:hypothetical protein
MNTRMRSLRFTLLISLFAAPAALAQTVQGVAEDFSGLAEPRASIVVIDDAGRETRGRLLHFDPESLTMTAAGRDLTFDRQHVASVYQRGDSLTNGMMIGLVTGAGFGFASGAFGTDCGALFDVRPCTDGEKARLGAAFGGVFGAIGMGIGAGVDALMIGRRLLYERPRRSEVPTVSISPSVAPSSTRLSLTVAW